MRRLLLSLTLAAPALVMGCGDDPAPLFADVFWHVQCRCYGMCSGIDPRDVNNIDGEDGNDITCSVHQRGGNDVLTFSVTNEAGYSFEIRDAEFPPGGGPVSGVGCQVRIRESGNTYQGACGASQPGEAQPCQITGLMVGTDEDGNPQISGNLLCLEIPSTSDNSIRREVTAPNSPINTAGGVCEPFPSGADTPTMPVTFRVVNCSGL